MARSESALLSGAWRRLLRNRAAVVAGSVLVVLAVLVVVAPWLTPHAPDRTHWDKVAIAPTLADGHLFGTDAVGRDLFARTLHGGRVSLLVGITATLVSLLIGVAWGATAGYLGGRTDSFMMRTVDVLYALPFIFLVILLMVVFGRNLFLIFVAIGAVKWLDMARIVRGQAIMLKRAPFVEAAVATGVPSLTVVRRHIVPNLLGVVVVYVTLTIPQVILIESFLSFLGLGVQEPATSWGALVADGAREMESAPWMLLFPAAFLAVTLFCFNFLGDGLRDALDPKERLDV